MATYDAVIVGAGHNGLITAAKLAKAGKKVLVLERRALVGGASVTEEIHPGFHASTLAYSPGLFQSPIAKELDLQRFGFQTLEYDPVLFAPNRNGGSLLFWKQTGKTCEEIARVSASDAQRYPAFQADMDRMVSFLKPLFTTSLPDPAVAGVRDLPELLSLSWKLHRLRERDILQMLRVLPMSIADLLPEYFENEHLKGVIASDGVMGSFYGPRSGGSVYVMLYLRMGREDGSSQPWPLIRGGMGALSNAIAQAARNAGVEIRTGVEVSKILIKDSVAQGVVLQGGDEIPTKIVISNADAKRTFLNLVDPVHLEPHFIQKIRNIKARGVSAKVNFALDRYPTWKGVQDGFQPAGVCIAPSMDYLEKAFDDAKYGSYSREPFIDITIPSVVDPTVAPTGKHVMSAYVLFAPYHLRSGNWNDLKGKFADNVVKTIEEYAPGFSSSILHRNVITPMDLETEYGLTEGHIHHGELSLDQVFFMRPVPGYSRYRTPVARLYLCGAAAHPGGGVTGLPGSLAAGEILSDFRSGKI